MFAKHTLFLLVVALVEARFGQEQGNGAVQAITALGDLGQSGQAASIAGGSIQFLLAAANPCGKLAHADKIVETLGTDDRVIAAARGYVAAEQNFNPFNAKVPSICADPDLPKTEALRGVVPLIDPDVEPKDVENTNAKASVLKPFDATGKSVADVMAANGFTNFTAVKLDGTKVNVTGGAAGGENKENKNAAGDKKEEGNAAGAGAGGASEGNKDNKSAANAAGDKKEGGSATVAEEGKNNEAGAGACTAAGGNQDNKNAAGDNKGGNATGAEEGQGKKETEEKQKAAGDEKNQNQTKACSAQTSSSDESKAAGANEKAGDANKKAEATSEDD